MKFTVTAVASVFPYVSGAIIRPPSLYVQRDYGLAALETSDAREILWPVSDVAHRKVVKAHAVQFIFRAWRVPVFKYVDPVSVFAIPISKGLRIASNNTVDFSKRGHGNISGRSGS